MTTIEQWVEKRSGTWGQAVQEALLALRAVADLHAHNSALNQDCAECVSSDHGYECTTKAVIHDALGIDGKDDTE